MNFLRLALVLIVLASTEAHATRKTDVIHFENGDKLTGEIKSLNGGILQLSTDAMGTINIEWPQITRIESIYYYEFRLSSGERHFGSLGESNKDRQIAVLNPLRNQEIAADELVEIRPIEEDWVDRQDVYVSLGYQFTSASSVSQTSFNTTVGYEDENTRNQLIGRSTNTQSQGDSSNSNRYDINRATWSNRSDWFRTIFANYEDNDELALNYRIGAGGGLGRYWIDNNQMRWIGISGLQVINEKAAGATESQEVELFLNTTFATWKFTAPELDVDLRLSLYPSVTDAGRLRTDSSIRVRWEIIDDLSLDISAWATSDNRSESGENYDYGITTGVGWEY